MLTAAALAFLVNIGGAVFNWVFKKVGRGVTQGVIFALALIAAVYWQYGSAFPTLQNYISVAVVIFSMAVAFYEVILRYFPTFSGPTIPTV
jgi:hypothetical protein